MKGIFVRRPALVLSIYLTFFSCVVRSQNVPISPESNLAARFPSRHQRTAGNSIVDVDGVQYSQLAAAIEGCPQTCWIMDTYPETFTVNPFTAIGTKSIRVTLGRGTWTTTVPIMIPTKSQLEGSGRGDGDFSGTVITASNSFPQNSRIIELGNVTPSFGVRVENLTIDCNNLPGVIGVYNDKSEEQSGLRHVLVENIAGIGLDVESAGAQNSGPYEDLELSGGVNSNVSAGSLCAKVVNVPAFRGIHGATCNFNNYSVHPIVGIQMDNSGTLTDIHIEGAENGIGLGVSAPGNGAILQNIYGGGPNITTLVHIYSGQNILLSGLVRSTTANVLVDDVLGQTITDTELALYFIGNGAPPNQTRFSSSVAADPHSQLSNLAVSNLSVSNPVGQLAVGRLSVTDLDVTGTITSKIKLPAANTATVQGSTTVVNPFVDSSTSTNVYEGIAVLDAHGQAEIVLPSSFNLLDRDIRYQLTPLGAYAPLFIASELNGNLFRIGGGTPGLRVSWSVTGTLKNLNAK
jgi:hypothetical protein